MAETASGYYKAELVRTLDRRPPWKNFDELESATFTRVHWHNAKRLHEYPGDVPLLRPKKCSTLGRACQENWRPLAKQILHQAQEGSQIGNITNKKNGAKWDFS